MNIYIGNLHFSVNSEEITQLFEQYGEVVSVNLMIDKSSGKSKGFAFVKLTDKDVALKSIDELNGKIIRGRTTKVSQAKSN